MLEASDNEKCSFVTLTYSDDHLPEIPEVSPPDLRNFIKRLRTNSGVKLRYFAVGEYGEQTLRPHYHLALFGLDYTDHQVINDSWGLGFVDVKFLEPASAMYICQYVTKKMTGKQDERLQIADGHWLHSEFARMSNRPGIGANTMKKIAKAYSESPWLLKNIDIENDVPSTLNIGNQEMPLGRYLKSKLRGFLGFTETGAQSDWQQKAHDKKMQTLLAIEQKNPDKCPYSYQNEIKQQKRLNIDAKLNNKNVAKRSI